jgi:hypothetical protein
MSYPQTKTFSLADLSDRVRPLPVFSPLSVPAPMPETSGHALPSAQAPLPDVPTEAPETLAIVSGTHALRCRIARGPAAVSKKLYVGNLPLTTTEKELRTLFERYGQVDRIRLVVDRETRQPNGFAFVEMPERTAADAAAQGLHGQPVAGQALRVHEASDRPAFGGGRGPRL